MQSKPKLLYPSMVIAAIAVTIFCLLGIAALMGVLPLAHSEADAGGASLPPAASAAAAGGTEMHTAAANARCEQCGTVESVTLVETKGSATGIGAVAGGIAGAFLGNGMGQGNGRTAMTILGGAGGAYAGNEIEKNTHKAHSYRIRVRMGNGTLRTIYQREQPSVATGDHVRIVSGTVVALS